jgi:Helix-turn-helix domain
VNYPAMRYVASEDCNVKGPGRAILWVIAFHADRDSGECWVGQRRLARESGFARSTVQRALDELFGDGILEFIEDHRGPKADRYQIAPNLVEGAASANGVIEGSASAAGIVEGQAVVGEVIHNPGSSGLAPGPLADTPDFLVDRSGWPSCASRERC